MTTSAVLLPSEAPALNVESLRVRAQLRLRAVQDVTKTRLSDLGEGGGYRIKFPFPDKSLEAVIVNTGGGLLGGDELNIDVSADAGAHLDITTQSAEKIYRTLEQPSRIDVKLTVAEGAALHWMPQESILFSGARLSREIHADVAANAELLIAESMTFGRIASGEIMHAGAVKDRWRIKRDGRLVFADDFALSGALAESLDRPAIAGGARASATLLLVAPDAESRLDAVRENITLQGVESGASAWNNMLVVRLLSKDPALLRKVMITTLEGLRKSPVPRFW